MEAEERKQQEEEKIGLEAEDAKKLSRTGSCLAPRGRFAFGDTRGRRRANGGIVSPQMPATRRSRRTLE
jgi:hypothetical protein